MSEEIRSVLVSKRKGDMQSSRNFRGMKLMSHIEKV